jgi:hypothetical protein
LHPPAGSLWVHGYVVRIPQLSHFHLVFTWIRAARSPYFPVDQDWEASHSTVS